MTPQREVVPATRGRGRPGATSAPQKDAGIETLRGLAIPLMVAGHVIGSGAQAGLHVPDDSGWRYAYFTLVPIRMPLFTAISGFVYALRPATRRSWPPFMVGKMRRLCIPFFVVGGAFVALQMIVPGANAQPRLADVPRMLIIPYAHFWYLYALLWVFLVVGTLDAFGLLERPWQWGLLLAASVALRASGLLATPLLGIWQAQYLLPFFVIGLGIHRFAYKPGRPLASSLLALGTLAVILHQGRWFGWWRIEGVERYLVSSAVGAVAVFGALVYRHPWNPLAALGRYSFGIYLMHVFGTAGTRILLRKAGVQNLPILAVSCLIVGVALPVLIERLIARMPLLKFLLLGTRLRAAEGGSSASRSVRRAA